MWPFSKKNIRNAGVLPHHLIWSQKWQCLGELDCDNPFNSYRSAFDRFLTPGDRTGGFYVTCKADADNIHEAFFNRCHLHAGDRLKDGGVKLGFHGRLPWETATSISYLNGAHLDRFCGGGISVNSLGDWLRGRDHGLSFHVDVIMSDWRSDHEDNLRDLIKMIVDNVGKQDDLAKTCLIFFALHCRWDKDKKEMEKVDEIQKVEGVIKKICPESDCLMLDDFSKVQPIHVRRWFERIVDRKDFHWLRDVGIAPLENHVFEGAMDGEQSLSLTLNRIMEFCNQSKPSPSMFGPA